ncbi:MAG: tyrosine-type recombinase/integrase [Maricaulaceae bacterium]
MKPVLSSVSSETNEDVFVAPDVTQGLAPMTLIKSGTAFVRLYNAFLHLSIRSDDSRQTYRSALSLFLRWLDSENIHEMIDIEPEHIRNYLDYRTKDLGRVASARLHYSAIKALFQYMVDEGALASNPAASVKYAFVENRKGRTPAIAADDVRAILLSVPDDPDCPERPAKATDLRDKALIGLMAYTFVRIGGALSTNVEDYSYENGEMWLNMVEKGAKAHRLPITGAARDWLDAYIEHCSLKATGADPRAPLFQSANRNAELNGNRYHRNNAWAMVSRRAKAAGIAGNTKNHTFRATGITRFLETGGRLDDAQDIANHANVETTRRYDRRDETRLIEVLKQVDY